MSLSTSMGAMIEKLLCKVKKNKIANNFHQHGTCQQGCLLLEKSLGKILLFEMVMVA